MVYLECDNPEVLAEHRALGPERVQWSREGSPWKAMNRFGRWDRFTAADAAGAIGEGWAYRLVFSDASAAGQGLVDYRDRLGARVERWSEANREWVLSLRLPEFAAANMAKGIRYRIAASVDPGLAASGAPTPKAGDEVFVPATVEHIYKRGGGDGVPLAAVSISGRSVLVPVAALAAEGCDVPDLSAVLAAVKGALPDDEVMRVITGEVDGTSMRVRLDRVVGPERAAGLEALVAIAAALRDVPDPQPDPPAPSSPIGGN